MRIVGVLIGIVALVVFSIFLVLAAPISTLSLATPELARRAEQQPEPARRAERREEVQPQVAPTGILYYLSRTAGRHLWLYFLLLLAACVVMVVGVVKNKIGNLTVWLFVGVAVLLNVLAIASIRLVAEYSVPRL